VDIRSIQKPLKEQYRREPTSSRITLTAKGTETATPLSCSVDIGRAIYQAEAHKGVGGTGTAACSGDLLIGALAACAQLTCQLVATAMGIPTRSIEVTVKGDMDLQGTLGISKDVPVEKGVWRKNTIPLRSGEEIIVASQDDIPPDGKTEGGVESVGQSRVL